MTAIENEVRAEAQRVWPNAKRINIESGGSNAVTATAIDANDHVIHQARAESLEALKANLENMLPEGGQAP